MEDMPQHGLFRGEVGTVVGRWKDDAFEVEFSDLSGRAYAFAALHSAQLLKLNIGKERWYDSRSRNQNVTGNVE